MLLGNCKQDESGAVDLVSIIMLILLPVIMVIKAVTYASDLVDKYSTHRHPAEAHRPDEDIPELLAFGGGVDSAVVAIQCDRDAGFAVVNSILEAKDTMAGPVTSLMRCSTS